MHTIDPRWFLPSSEVKPFVFDVGRADLAAADTETMATGRFVVARVAAPVNQVYVVKAMAFYAMQRISAGLATETVRLIDPRDANGFFSFEPLVNDNNPWLIGLDYNAPRLAAAPVLQNSDRQRTGGITWMSLDPWRDVQNAWFNPMSTFVIPGTNTFKVIFSILPAATASPLPAGGLYAVAGAGGARRVDFAGAIIAGVQMTEQAYTKMVDDVERAPGV